MVTIAGPVYRGEGLGPLDPTLHVVEAPADVAVDLFRVKDTHVVDIGSFTAPVSPDIGLDQPALLDTDLPWTDTDLDTDSPYVVGDFTPQPYPVSGSIARLMDPPLDDEVSSPIVRYPVDTQARAVTAVNLMFGAYVTLQTRATANDPWEDVSSAWSGDRSRATLEIPSSLTAGTLLRIVQDIPTTTELGHGWTSTTSVTGTVTNTVPSLGVPAITFVVERGATVVAVDGVTPGSLVEIKDEFDAVVGSALFGEPVGHVPICPATDEVSVTVTRGFGGSTVTEDSTIQETLALPEVGEFDVNVGDVGENPDIELPLPIFYAEYLPIEREEIGTVFIMHGINGGNNECAEPCDFHFAPSGGFCFHLGTAHTDNSFLAYDPLGERLASLGVRVVSMVVAPMDMPLLDGVTTPRVDWFEMFVDRYIHGHPGSTNAHEDVAERPIVTLGHSMGGETAIAVLERLLDAELDVRAGVALAPVSYENVSHFYDVPVTTELLVLYGDHDFFEGDGNAFQPGSNLDLHAENAFFAELPGGNHGFFNECWDFASDDIDIPRDVQLRWTTEVVTRFVIPELLGSPLEEAMYHLHDASQAPGTWVRHPGFSQRFRTFTVVDDFEDGTPSTNALTQAVTISSGLTASEVDWASEAALRDTMAADGNRALKLSWAADKEYRTRIDGLDTSVDSVLTFEMARDQGSAPGPNLAIDLAVILEDTEDRQAAVAMGAFAEAAIPTGGRETITIPFRAFKAVKSALDLQNPKRIIFKTVITPASTIYIDNIRIRED